jgi:hypothetical protein
MNVARIFLFASSLMLVAGSLAGCGGGESTVERAERLRREQLAQEYSQWSGIAFLFAAIYVAVILLGPSVIEWSRGQIVRHFNWSKETQIEMAQWIYFGITATIGIGTLISPHLWAIKLAVVILVGATLQPFFNGIVPSIETNDKQRRKAAVAQIKSLWMLILVFYIILRLKTPEGFSGLKF